MLFWEFTYPLSWKDDRIPAGGGGKLSAAVQTGSGAHAASCTIGTGFFHRVKRPGRGVNHPPPCSADVKERVDLYIYSPSGPSWPVIGRTLTLKEGNTTRGPRLKANWNSGERCAACCHPKLWGDKRYGPHKLGAMHILICSDNLYVRLCVTKFPGQAII